nr:hypothetical protein [Neorhizobium galegae]
MVENMHALPLPDFSDYFAELEQSLYADRVYPGLPMEFSRGCWWQRSSLRFSDRLCTHGFADRTNTVRPQACQVGRQGARPPLDAQGKQKQDVHEDLATGMSISAIARKFATSRETIMRVRDESSRSVRS